jgi:hypothetical protein
MWYNYVIGVWIGTGTELLPIFLGAFQKSSSKTAYGGFQGVAPLVTRMLDA